MELSFQGPINTIQHQVKQISIRAWLAYFAPKIGYHEFLPRITQNYERNPVLKGKSATVSAMYAKWKEGTAL
jgi:hypothetical protein